VTAAAWRASGSPVATNHSSTTTRDGTFTDVTAKAGVGSSGWGQGVCVGDYDNDGFDDLFVTYYGRPNILYHTTATAPSPTWARRPASAGQRGN